MKEPVLGLVLLSLWFSLFYGSADLAARFIPYRLLPPQPSWPFLPSWVIVYLSINILLAVCFLRSGSKAKYLLSALLWQTVLAWPFFVFLPLAPIVVPTPTPARLAFGLADTINLDNNYLPSLHVGYALTCVYFYRNPLTVVWSLAIIASTLLTYQHYPVDIIGGALLAGVAVWWSTRPGRVVSICIGELIRCSTRHPRYGAISLALVGYLLVRPAAGRKAILGFCYLQRIDDLLDGHLQCSGEPEEIADEQIRAWETGTSTDDELHLLGGALHECLPEKENIVAVIEEMKLDRRRVRESLLLEQSELRVHLNRTFELSLNLMLAAADSELRASDAQDLVELLGWCSVVRDLEEDLELGLLNVPREVIEEERLESWFQDELKRARKLYGSAAEQMEALKHRKGAGLLKLFHRSVRKYLKNHNPQQAADAVRQYWLSM